MNLNVRVQSFNYLLEHQKYHQNPNIIIIIIIFIIIIIKNFNGVSIFIYAGLLDNLYHFL
jgi:hypothetical protein